MSHGFDRIARSYRWLEHLTFGPTLTRSRNHFLPQLADRRRALILGDGDGRFTARLLTENAELHAEAVDCSAAMLELLCRRTRLAHPTAAGRLETHPCDAREFSPNGMYDLVVTHFFLDCLTQSEVDRLALTLRSRMAPGALWVVSEFRVPPGVLRAPALALVRALYFGFRLMTGLRTTRLPDHAAALEAAGLTRIAQHLSLAGILTSEMWTNAPHSRAGV